jgi:hypothetical protein
MKRRAFIKMVGLGVAAPAILIRGAGMPSLDDALLGDLQKRALRYFVDHADNVTGLVREGANTDGAALPPKWSENASISATGFGLAAFCVGGEHGWMPHDEARKRVITALRTVDQSQNEQGWSYHWLNIRTGARSGAAGVGGDSEISSVDYAFFLAGALTARGYFRGDAEIADLVGRLYGRVDFPWMLAPGSLRLSHGWTPEAKFLPATWDSYSEAMVLYLLALGSPTRPVAPAAWYSWERNPNTYGSYRFVGTQALFTFQYSHAFVDFRGKREHAGSGTDWFGNSQAATRAHRQFCMDLSQEFTDYSADVWGITCSEGPYGYTIWAGPPRVGPIDGSVVPCAAGGSLMFEPGICLPALRTLKTKFGDKVYGRYGFADAFNPRTGWVAPNVHALDAGITLLSAENLRTGNIWNWFMRAPEIQKAMQRAQIQG